MRIAVIALGSRGDVQPYIALAKGIYHAGHSVRLLTHENFEALAAAHGLEFWPVRGDVQAVAQSEEMRELLEKGNFLAITRQTAKAVQGAARLWAQDGLAACQGVDLIVGGIGGLNVGLALAEKLNLPFVQSHIIPFTPTSAFPGALFPASVSRLGGTANRLSHHLVRQVMWQGFRSADTQMRREELGLPAAPFWGPYNAKALYQRPILYGISPSVIAKPVDWNDNIHVTGYWFLDAEEGWTPPPALLDFLDAGPAPICVGFGSMAARNPQATAGLAIEAAKRAGQRAILLSGWSGLRQGDLPDSVFVAESLPHAWLFPRAAAVVHHGGAGTTAAGLRAGVPSLAVPFFGDQAFWGQRMADLGVGPAPIPRKRLTVDHLVQAMQQMTGDHAMRSRAADLGARIRAEDGIARAVAILQQIG